MTRLLHSCAERNRKCTKRHEEISQSVRKAEASLEHFVSQELRSLADCTERLEKLQVGIGAPATRRGDWDLTRTTLSAPPVQVLQEDLDSARKHLEETEEWCPQQRCRGPRETSVVAAWRRVTKLRLCSQQLTARIKRRIVEWSEVTRGVSPGRSATRLTKTGRPLGVNGSVL